MQIIALAVGLSGTALICSPMEMNWRAPGAAMGCLFLLVGAIAWSVTIPHIRHHRWTGSPLALAPWQMLLAAIPLAGCAWAVEGAPHFVAVNDRLLGVLFFIGPVATSACFVMSAEHGRRITIFAMSNFTLGVPLIGIVASWLFLGNRITGPFLIGLILVFSGAVIAAAAGRSGVGKQRGGLFRRGQARRYNRTGPTLWATAISRTRLKSSLRLSSRSPPNKGQALALPSISRAFAAGEQHHVAAQEGQAQAAAEIDGVACAMAHAEMQFDRRELFGIEPRRQCCRQAFEETGDCAAAR